MSEGDLSLLGVNYIEGELDDEAREWYSYMMRTEPNASDVFIAFESN
jgi:hypothetical protein